MLVDGAKGDVCSREAAIIGAVSVTPRRPLKIADPIWTVISAETDLEALGCCCSGASRREGWAVAAVTGRGVPATLARAGRVGW